MINKDFKIILFSGLSATVVLSAVCFYIEPLCAAITLTLGIFLTVVFSVTTKKRYDKLNALNDYMSLVCSGNYNLDIADNSEGELSILKNNLYKVISILRTQNELLRNDKLFLADSLADISHQLKTPLTSMMVMTDLLKEDITEDKKSEFLGVIENQLIRMKWLITNLLKISKLDAGTIVLKPEKTGSCELVSKSVEPFELMLELRNISLLNNTDSFFLNVDFEWTVEAIRNIVKNCIEHTDNKGEIVICTDRTNIYDSIIISDNGCGIAPEDLPHIFERFYHGRNSSDESVGIGLALSKAILEKENADISVISTEGEGTRFEIKFYKGII